MSVSDMLTTIAENQERVYNAGFEAGKDSFWADFTNRSEFNYAFAFWPEAMFKPKGVIKPTGTGANDMFYKTYITDVATPLNGVLASLDLSFATSLYNTFSSDKITKIPILNLASCTQMTLSFANAKVQEIIINNLSENCVFNRAFRNCYELRDLTINGTIGKVDDSNDNGLNLSYSTKLSAESVKCVLDALREAGPLQGSKVIFNATVLDNAKSAYPNLEDKISTLNNAGWAISGEF